MLCVHTYVYVACLRIASAHAPTLVLSLCRFVALYGKERLAACSLPNAMPNMVILRMQSTLVLPSHRF